MIYSLSPYNYDEVERHLKALQPGIDHFGLLFGFRTLSLMSRVISSSIFGLIANATFLAFSQIGTTFGSISSGMGFPVYFPKVLEKNFNKLIQQPRKLWFLHHLVFLRSIIIGWETNH